VSLPSLIWSLIAVACLSVVSFEIQAQSQLPAVVVPQGRSWASLSPTQQAALAPLQREWDTIDTARKTKWIEVADRLAGLPPQDRARIQARMADWAKLSPTDRGQARLNFKDLQALPVEDRKARWEAYQALSPEEQRRLAARNAPRAAASAPATPFRRETGATKSNLVPSPAFGVRRKAVSPAISEAQRGATIHLVSRPPAQPAHQQPGFPKVATEPAFIDSNTLLPKRGAQAASARGRVGGAAAPVIDRP